MSEILCSICQKVLYPREPRTDVPYVCGSCSMTSGREVDTTGNSTGLYMRKGKQRAAKSDMQISFETHRLKTKKIEVVQPMKTETVKVKGRARGRNESIPDPMGGPGIVLQFNDQGIAEFPKNRLYALEAFQAARPGRLVLVEDVVEAEVVKPALQMSEEEVRHEVEKLLATAPKVEEEQFDELTPVVAKAPRKGKLAKKE